jgi:hypothetical protein
MTFTATNQQAQPITAWEPYVAPERPSTKLYVVMPTPADPPQPRQRTPFRLRSYRDTPYFSHRPQRLMGGYA